MSDNNGAAEMTNEPNTTSTTERLLCIARWFEHLASRKECPETISSHNEDAATLREAADELDRLREDRDAFRASSEIRGQEVERLRARIAELERESDMRMPHGWRAKKENGQWRLEQWRDEWIRATWVDSPVVSKFIDDMAAEALAKDGARYPPPNTALTGNDRGD